MAFQNIQARMQDFFLVQLEVPAPNNIIDPLEILGQCLSSTSIKYEKMEGSELPVIVTKTEPKLALVWARRKQRNRTEVVGQKEMQILLEDGYRTVTASVRELRQPSMNVYRFYGIPVEDAISINQGRETFSVVLDDEEYRGYKEQTAKFNISE